MRLRTYFISLALALFSHSALAADHYEFDKSHTHIAFYVNHLGFSDMLGLFTSYNGTFQFDPHHPEQSSMDVTLRPNGIRTSSDALDIVLRGEDYFNTEKFSDIHFVSTKIRTTSEQHGDVEGNLTMLGVTKPFTLHVHFNKADYQPVTNLYIAGFNAQGTLKRSDWGMSKYTSMISDEVRIEISTEGINQDRKQAEKIKH